jgi:hypothetical protein
MAAWHYDLFLIATGSIEIEALTSRLSRDLAALESPSQNLRLWGSLEGDRIDFWIDHQPVQLLARFDLRHPSESFRRLVLELAREFSSQLVNGDDVEIAPKDSALLADMRSSAAQAAAANPEAEGADDEE